MKKKNAKGWSVFRRKADKVFVLDYATRMGQRQKRVPREIQTHGDAVTWARTWLSTQGINAELVLEQRRERGVLIKDCEEGWAKLRDRLVTRKELAPASADDNKTHVRTHIVPKFGEKSFAELEVTELRKFFRELADKRSVSTTRNVYYSFRTFYGDAMGEGWVKSDANLLDHPLVKGVIPESQSDREDHDAVIVPFEIAQQLVHDERVPEERALRYLMGFATGERDGELAARTLSDLQLDATPPTMRVHNSLSSRTRELGKTKTKAGRRVVPLHPAVVAGLRDWFANGWIKLRGVAPGPSDPIFPGVRKLFVRPPSAKLLHIDITAIEAKGLEHVVFHGTRHSLNTWLLDRKVDKVVRQRFLGHAGQDVTDGSYTGEVIQSMYEAVCKLPFTWRGGVTEAPRHSGEPSKSSDETSSHEDAPSHSVHIELSNVGDTSCTSEAVDSALRIAKPTYVGSNPIRTSE